MLFHNDTPGSINDIHNRERIFIININNSHWFIKRVFDEVKDDFRRQQAVEPLPDTAVKRCFCHVLDKVNAYLGSQ